MDQNNLFPFLFLCFGYFISVFSQLHDNEYITCAYYVWKVKNGARKETVRNREMNICVCCYMFLRSTRDMMFFSLTFGR